MSGLKRQRGVALLTIMLILAVMVLIASQFSQRLQLDIARATNLQQYTHLQWLASGGEAFAVSVLKQDVKDDDNVHLEQYWATEGLVLPVEDSMLSGRIRDMQACFNLNALGQPNRADGQPPRVVDQFIALLVALEVEGYLAEQIADSLRDWIDADTIPHPLGAEDSTYEAMNPPYLPANGPLADRSELRAINGVTAAVYQKVEPYVCALPEGTQVFNVNTISEEHPELLVALFQPQLDLYGAQQVLADRPREGYNSVEEYMTHPMLTGISLTQSNLSNAMSLSSSYFEADVKVENEQGQAHMRSLIKRSGNDQFVVLRRKTGGGL
ncbi:type II secretion system minor pseudopilin GspK [Aliagarivorans taiwanensis]|uniref:type II secretion system minor pseudopilin GspK n=1 Tax=Aliagarivorans taiwanensis TaxID=561966 RepID=UPI000412E28B|nr:type II secretion system minor pseudopilin GspK [Aliagarivorans taiwanensis]